MRDLFAWASPVLIGGPDQFPPLRMQKFQRIAHLADPLFREGYVCTPSERYNYRLNSFVDKAFGFRYISIDLLDHAGQRRRGAHLDTLAGPYRYALLFVIVRRSGNANSVFLRTFPELPGLWGLAANSNDVGRRSRPGERSYGRACCGFLLSLFQTIHHDRRTPSVILVN